MQYITQYLKCFKCFPEFAMLINTTGVINSCLSIVPQSLIEIALF